MGGLVFAWLAACASLAQARPLSLGEAVQVARKQAPAVQTAQASVQVAQGEVRQAEAPRNPVLTASAAGNLFLSSGQYFFSGLTTSSDMQRVLYADGSLDVRWLLTDFGKTGSRVTSAEKGVSAALDDRRAAEHQAMGGAAAAYMLLVADDRMITAAEQSLQSRQHALEITEDLVRSGVRSPVEQTRSQVARDVAELDLTSARGKRQVDGSDLAAALGLPPGETIEVQAPTLKPVAHSDPASAMADALRRRPDLQAAERRVQQQQTLVDATSAPWRPRLSAQGSFLFRYARRLDSYSEELAGSRQSTSEVGLAGVVLEFPLFDPTLRAQHDQAYAGAAFAQAALDAGRLTAQHAAVQASTLIRTAQAALSQANRLADASAASLATVEARYASGLSGPLELLDAQGVDRDARVRQVQTSLALDLAVVKYLLVTGRIDELGGP